MTTFVMFTNKLKSFSLLSICLLISIFFINLQIVNAGPMDNYQDGNVTEELRLKIPANLKKVWLVAEKRVWEPWLSRQDGFLGRQIFWDKEKEEALILIKWENRRLWKNISIEEVNEIQQEFDENVKKSLNANTNPFELIHEGELYQQG